MIRMTAQERASEFVKKYQALFTEDKDFWASEIEAMLVAREKEPIIEDERYDPSQPLTCSKRTLVHEIVRLEMMLEGKNGTAAAKKFMEDVP